MSIIQPAPPQTGRHPHEVVAALMCIFSGFVSMFRDTSPLLSRVFGDVFNYSFAAALVLGGIITIYGIWNVKLQGPLIERAGLIILGAATLAYPVMMIGTNGLSVLVPSTLPFAFAIASFLRVWQISRQMKRWRVALR